MKLAVSRKDDPRGRHLILVMDRAEMYQAHEHIVQEVLRGRRAERDLNPADGTFLYRFHQTFLDRLLLVFPHAELSPGADKLIVARQRKQFEDMPVPDLSIPGFYDYLAETEAEPYNFQKIGIGKIEDEIAKVEEWLATQSDSEVRELERSLKLAPAFLLNDEMGLGKTIQALGVAIRNRWFPTLIVTPNSGKWSTKRIIDRFFDDDFTYQVIDGTRVQRETQIDTGADVVIINVEGIRMQRDWNKHLQKWEINDCAHPGLFFDDIFEYRDTAPELRDKLTRRKWKFLVVDEHHKCKNPDAQQTKGFLQLQAEKYLFMSGTPIMNRVEEMWPVLHKMDPDRFPTSYHFEKNICIKEGSSVIGYQAEAMLELKRYIESRSIRRRRDHVSKDMPKIVTSIREVELTAEQRKLYNRIRDELLLELEDGSTRKVMNILTEMTRLKQACFSPELYGGSKNSAKLTEMKEDVRQLVDSGEKAIIFSQWSKATRILQREFMDYNPAYVDGSVKGKHRSAQEDKFNLDDDCHLYIGTIKANQEAITLGAATYVLFADKEWTPMANDQAFGRSAGGGLRGIHLGPDQKIFRIEYHAKDTIEDRIEELLMKKQAIFNSLIERDGGIRIPKMTVKDIRLLLAA